MLESPENENELLERLGAQLCFRCRKPAETIQIKDDRWCMLCLTHALIRNLRNHHHPEDSVADIIKYLHKETT